MSKRFYDTVAVGSAPDGHHILLDGRVLKTPNGHALAVSDRSKAELVAEEWRAQGETINPASMPVTRLINVALEQTPTRRDELVNEYRQYMSTDLVCYRAEHPQDLKSAQSDAWDPVVEWARGRGLALNVTEGIIAINQPETTLDAARKIAEGFDNIQLTLLLHLTATLGSAVLALAVMEGHFDIEQGWELSRIDEAYQITRWGEDEEAADISKATQKELRALAPLI